MYVEFKFIKESTSNPCQEIRRTNIGKDWMDRYGHSLQPINAIENLASKIFHIVIDGFIKARETSDSQATPSRQHNACYVWKMGNVICASQQ